MDPCDHQLPARAAGLPDDHVARHAAAHATITRLTDATELADRRLLAEAWLVLVELECARAERASLPAQAAEVALRSLADVVGGDVDPTLRAALFYALVRIAWARRLAAPPGRGKVDVEVAVLEGAIALAERAPCVEALVAAGLAHLVRTGQFQVEADVRERAFSAARELCDRFGDTRSSAVAREVVRGLDEWLKMVPRNASERGELSELRTRLLSVSAA
jgi:hypothetical protein